ncbi:MAG: DUF481 domain-containing protein [Thermoguttaceae bacterium]|jgi:putative salt-induced outer membrane protein YdiY|nr:DUF481 domain-containing protein [Thermoguttaceae bacterium]
MAHRLYFALLVVPWFLVAAGADESVPAPPGLLRLPPIDEPAGESGESTASEADEATPTARPPDYVPVFLFPAYTEMAAWSGSFELGLDGSTGNSETFNLRFGLDLERKWDIHQIDIDLDYMRKTANGVDTANRSFLDWRYERLFRDTRWTWFVHGTFEYNDFEAWDSRVTADTGLGYKLIATDSTKLTSRAGGGFSRKIGLPEDEWIPELVLGLDFEHKVGKRHRLKAKVDYMPDVTDFTTFRINSQASWEMLIDEGMNLSLKFSALSRYDSAPKGAKPHDLDYSAVVMWRF